MTADTLAHSDVPVVPDDTADRNQDLHPPSPSTNLVMTRHPGHFHRDPYGT